MNNDKKRSISVGRIVILLIILLPIAAIAWGSISQQLEFSRLKSAISQVTSQSGVEPKSMKCSNIELANVCTADYGTLSYDAAKEMLVKSGYSISDAQDSLTGKNESLKTSVRGDFAGGTASTQIEFKDINVTL